MPQSAAIAVLIIGILVAIVVAILVARFVKVRLVKRIISRYKFLADGLSATWSSDGIAGLPVMCGIWENTNYRLTIIEAGFSPSLSVINYGINRRKRTIHIEFPVDYSGSFTMKPSWIDARNFTFEEVTRPSITAESLLLELQWQASCTLDMEQYLKSQGQDHILADLFTAGMREFTINNGVARIIWDEYFKSADLSAGLFKDFFNTWALPKAITLDEITPLLEKAIRLA